MTIITLTLPLSCMNEVGEHNDLIKEIILYNDITLLSHSELCALALVDKSWNNKIQKTAIVRRKHLENNIPNFPITWHKYGSAYSYLQRDMPLTASYPLYEKLRKGIHLNLVFFNGNNNIDQKCLEGFPSWYKEGLPVEDISLTFFSKKEETCLYAYGWVPDTGKFKEIIKESIGIVEYSLDTNGKQKLLECFVDVNGSTKLQILKDCPVLLQAFFNSKCITESESKKVYGVEGLELDEDYTIEGIFPNQKIKEEIIKRCLVRKNNSYIQKIKTQRAKLRVKLASPSMGEEELSNNIHGFRWIYQEKKYSKYYLLKNKTFYYDITHPEFQKKIDGYSFLGITILLPKASFEEKSRYIQTLFTLGFVPTEGDEDLAYLEKWERFFSNNIKFLYCVMNDKKNILSLLPKELVMYIFKLIFDTEKSLLYKNQDSNNIDTIATQLNQCVHWEL